MVPAKHRAASFALALTVMALAAEAGRATQPATDEAAAMAPRARWDVEGAVVTIDLDAAMLEGLGLRVESVRPNARRTPQPLSVVSPTAPSFEAATEGLAAEVDHDTFRGFAGGELRLTGELRLRSARGPFDLSGGVLRPTEDPFSLELVDRAGDALLRTAGAQWDLDLDAGTLRFKNADLRLLPAFARRLGDDRLAGLTIGAFELELDLSVGARPLRLATAASSTPPACGDWGGEIDVALTDLDAVGQRGNPQNARLVVVPSVTLKNVGTANVPWYSKFTGTFPPYGNDQHPFLVWQLLREHDGVLEPIGRSEMKHAFQTGNYRCQPGACTDPHVLGLGCEDPYNIASNSWYSALGPRDEVTASTGVWAHCNEPAPGTVSHFDTNGDCVPDHNDAVGDYHAHGMDVAESDLRTEGARYFMEAFYVIRGDVDIFNTMGFREVAPLQTGPATWTFPVSGPYRQGPVVNLWSPPVTPGTSSDNRYVDTGEGRVQVAVRVTALGGGLFRYAWALHNHDFDRRIGSFRVPLDPTGVTQIGFADGDADAGNDWPGSVDATGITWTAPASQVPAAEIDWATLFAFHLDSPQPPGQVLASLAVHEPGSPAALAIRTLAPGGNAPVTNFHTVPPCRLLDTRSEADGAAPVRSGRVRTVEVAGRCGIPADATAVTVNVTMTGATAPGYLAAYGADHPQPPTTSALNVTGGGTKANNAIVELSPQGRLALRPALVGAATAHLVLDVAGYFAPEP
jgi:hypothetical protein